MNSLSSDFIATKISNHPTIYNKLKEQLEAHAHHLSQQTPFMIEQILLSLPLLHSHFVDLLVGFTVRKGGSSLEASFNMKWSESESESESGSGSG